MFSTWRSDPRGRATRRWGGALAAMLVLQSLIMAAVFWVLANGNHRRAIDHALADDCTFFAMSPTAERAEELNERLTRDIHRDRFLGLFAPDGRLIAGNIARLPTAPAGRGSFIATLEPTELPGKSRDEARVSICTMPDGTRLLSGFDLDDTEEALRLVWQSLLLGLVPGVALALAFGFVAGRRAARQVDTIRRLTERIIAGDLGGRLPVAADPDSFGLLCADINRMLDRLQQLVGDVRGIGDDIAHQLRTPLTRLRARVERSMRDAADRPAFVAAGERSLAEIDALLGIVGALLRLREIEDHARRSRFAPVDLPRLVEDACDLYRPTAEERGLILTCSVAPVPPIEGDASLLMEAIANLIDNAMKFGPPGGTVRIVLAAIPGGSRITVADDGPGIRRADRDLVTQRFYRGRADRESASGSASSRRSPTSTASCCASPNRAAPCRWSRSRPSHDRDRSTLTRPRRRTRLRQPAIRRNLAALSCRMSRFCLAVRKGAFRIRWIATPIAPGHTMLSEPNMMRCSKPASIKR